MVALNDAVSPLIFKLIVAKSLKSFLLLQVVLLELLRRSRADTAASARAFDMTPSFPSS